MEKVKVTKEQAEAIERGIKIYGKDRVMNDHEPDGVWVGNLVKLNGLTKCEIAKALYIGYEVEPEFKVGDWVVYIHDNTVCDVVAELHGGKIHYDITKNGKHVGSVHKDHLRKATPEEIEQEKERRFWAKHGRNPWELKQDDVLYRKDDDFLVIVDGIHTSPNDEKTVIYKGGDWEYFKNVIDEFKVICFAENRLDLSN